MNKDCGARIMQARKILKLSQDSFSKSLGISQAHISQVEKGDKEASELLIKHICLQYYITEEWLETGEGRIFISPEEALVKIIARYGERAIFQAFNIIMKERSLAVAKDHAFYHASTGDPDLDRMVNTLYSLWATGDDRLKIWASVQFDHAIPADVVEEAQKKQQEAARQSETG